MSSVALEQSYLYHDAYDQCEELVVFSVTVHPTFLILFKLTLQSRTLILESRLTSYLTVPQKY